VDFALPVIVAVAAWWLSTVVLIYRAGLPPGSFLTTLVGTTVVMLLGVGAVVASRDDASAVGAYLAFFGGLAIWAWHEVSYLFGYVSGPRPKPCPPDASGWRRFVLGVKTCIYHELAVIATALGIAALVWGAANRVALWTFAVLWLMRWSAKLNIFLGVRNLHEEFWPDHLKYLTTFVRRRSMNKLFPLSIGLASVALAALAFVAIDADGDLARRTGAVLLATLLTLAIIEHGFLVLKLSDDLLWRPGLRSRRKSGAPAN
jgi:putative photosynthetic complex assembly protein 2